MNQELRALWKQTAKKDLRRLESALAQRLILAVEMFAETGRRREKFAGFLSENVSFANRRLAHPALSGRRCTVCIARVAAWTSLQIEHARDAVTAARRLVQPWTLFEIPYPLQFSPPTSTNIPISAAIRRQQPTDEETSDCGKATLISTCS